MGGSAVFRGSGDTDRSSCLGMPVRLSCSSLARGSTLLDFSLQPWDHVVRNGLQQACGTLVLAAAIPRDVAPHSWLAECL